MPTECSPKTKQKPSDYQMGQNLEGHGMGLLPSEALPCGLTPGDSSRRNEPPVAQEEDHRYLGSAGAACEVLLKCSPKVSAPLAIMNFSLDIKPRCEFPLALCQERADDSTHVLDLALISPGFYLSRLSQTQRS